VTLAMLDESVRALEAGIVVLADDVTTNDDTSEIELNTSEEIACVEDGGGTVVLLPNGCGTTGVSDGV